MGEKRLSVQVAYVRLLLYMKFQARFPKDRLSVVVAGRMTNDPVVPLRILPPDSRFLQYYVSVNNALLRNSSPRVHTASALLLCVYSNTIIGNI
jgi:hypothetical protein